MVAFLSNAGLLRFGRNSVFVRCFRFRIVCAVGRAVLGLHFRCDLPFRQLFIGVGLRSRRRFVVVVLAACFVAVVFFVVRLLRSMFLLPLIVCERSTSPPGGNQVDGLPPALSPI